MKPILKSVSFHESATHCTIMLGFDGCESVACSLPIDATSDKIAANLLSMAQKLLEDNHGND